MVSSINSINNVSFKSAQTASNPEVKPKAAKTEEELIVDDFVKEATTPTSLNKKSVRNVRRLLKNSVDSWQRFLKFKARATEYTKGLINGVVAGLGVGASVMAMDWAMNGIARVSKKEASSTMFVTEPAKLVGRSFAGVFKAIYNIPNLTIKQLAKNIVHSPIDLFNYVKDAPNVTKVGKTFAPILGLTAMGYCLTKSVLRANCRVANIEHAFNSGHAHDLK